MLKKVFRVLGEKLEDIIYCADHVKYARKLGVKVGNDCKFLCNVRRCFGNEPFLITIGDHVEVCDSVRFMPHDGAAWVYRDKMPKAAIYGRIIVGNNVFIGINSIILPNVKIGNNVIIGAGSVVTRDIPDNSVYAGVPAKLIRPINMYYDKVEKLSVPALKMSKEERQEYLKEKYPEWFPGE